VSREALSFDPRLKADWNHSADYILGSLEGHTLKVNTDSRGATMEVDVPNCTWANDLLVSIKRGDVSGCSFAFRILPGGVDYETDSEGRSIHILRSILVRRLSISSDPAYLQTTVEVRNNRNSTRRTPLVTPATPGDVAKTRRALLDILEQF
jgi:hypothetical protein